MIEEDIELIKKAKLGDEDAMQSVLNNNKSLVTAIARKYYLLGGDKEDLIQEGMIGFFKAINSFDFSKNNNFKNYAIMLIEREIISAIRSANTNNNNLFNDCVSLDDNFISVDSHPEIDLISEENCKELNDEINKLLSKFESKVVSLYLKGYTYTDIAKILNKEPKIIDNALTRIKSKLKFLKERL